MIACVRCKMNQVFLRNGRHCTNLACESSPNPAGAGTPSTPRHQTRPLQGGPRPLLTGSRGIWRFKAIALTLLFFGRFFFNQHNTATCRWLSRTLRGCVRSAASCRNLLCSRQRGGAWGSGTSTCRQCIRPQLRQLSACRCDGI